MHNPFLTVGINRANAAKLTVEQRSQILSMALKNIDVEDLMDIGTRYKAGENLDVASTFAIRLNNTILNKVRKAQKTAKEQGRKFSFSAAVNRILKNKRLYV